ncbi:sugar phosphate isomerase/epimerase family protein [Aggregatilineales bacterium SYSU G02658]
MYENVLLSAGRENIEQCADLARHFGLGIEVMAFAFPDVLDGDVDAEVARYQHWLKDVPGPITLHGPFFDMVSGSLDARINALCTERYQQAISIAAELGAAQIVLHANFIGSLHNLAYREGWHQRSVDFWGPIADFAQARNVPIAMENMWEFDPSIITDLLQAVNSPYLRACLDVGHAHIFSKPEFDLATWIEAFTPWIIHFHLNNNNGILDEHHAFDWEGGTLNYHELLPPLRAQFPQALFVLEMDTVDDMKASLPYFSQQPIKK